MSYYDPVVAWGGDSSTKPRVAQFVQALGDSVDVTAFTPGEFVAQGDPVASMGEFGCRARATGKSALTRWVFIWKFQDGRVSSYEQFHDPALAAAFRP